MEQYLQLKASASNWGTASTWALILLGALDFGAFILAHVFKVKWAIAVEVIGFIALLALGVIDCELRSVDDDRAALAETAFLDRSISPEAHAAAVKILRAEPSRQIEIQCFGTSERETLQYCGAIDSIFVDGGWGIRRNGIGIYAGGPPIVGVRIGTKTLSAGADQVRAAMAAAKIAVVDDPNASGSEDHLVLAIGQKPGLPN